MTTRDTPEAALATAEHKYNADERGYRDHNQYNEHPYPCEVRAAAILAAMPDWRLVPADTSLAYDTGFQDGLLEAAEIWQRPDPEIERLTRELDASRTLAAKEYADAERLRAALRQIAMTPKAHKLVASICETALAPAPSEPLMPRAVDDPEYMCPNCVTPWKCNGPHVPQQESEPSRRIHGTENDPD